MARFHAINRDIDFLFPPSVQEWLPESHLARYVASVVEGLDLSEIERAYAGYGSDAYPPRRYPDEPAHLRLCHRRLLQPQDRAGHLRLDRLPLPGCNRHPDHDTLCTFRRRFGERFESLFVQVLQIAQANQIGQFATLSLDGTKIHANASRHSALSYEHAGKIEAQLQLEVQEPLALAETADPSGVPEGLSVPAEIARREEQLQAIQEAKRKIEARAKERYQREKAEFDAKLKARERKEAPRAQDQINLTDEQSRIMKVAGEGFEQCYNAQAAVDTESMRVLASQVTQAANDKQQVEPMLAKLQALPEGLNAPQSLLADTGYPSEANLEAARMPGSNRRSPSGARATTRTGRNASANHRPCPRRPPRSRRCGTPSRRRRARRPMRYANRRWSRSSASSSPSWGFASSCCVAWSTCSTNGHWCAWHGM